MTWDFVNILLTHFIHVQFGSVATPHSSGGEGMGLLKSEPHRKKKKKKSSWTNLILIKDGPTRRFIRTFHANKGWAHWWIWRWAHLLSAWNLTISQCPYKRENLFWRAYIFNGWTPVRNPRLSKFVHCISIGRI